MINRWLENLKTGWTAKDIAQVLDLFTDDVEYWETPHQIVKDKDALQQEWNAILRQESIQLDLKVFSSIKNRHSVLWRLSYVNKEGVTQDWAGTYLIELDHAGKCNYFHQTGETL